MWPPRPNFNDWPDPWAALVQLADDMPAQLATAGSAEEFRSWMTVQCAERVDCQAVLTSIDELVDELPASECAAQWGSGLDRLFGLLACTTYLVHPLPYTRLMRLMSDAACLKQPTRKYAFFGECHRSQMDACTNYDPMHCCTIKMDPVELLYWL